MLTKNISAPTIEHYSLSLSVEYPAGRSAIAQKLHAVSENKRLGYSKNRMEDDRQQATEVQDGLDNASSKHSEKDAWTSRGEDGKWQRQHLRVRRSLFAPLRVAQGPDSSVHLMRVRATKGVNLITMKSFSIVDNWTQASNAHRLLDFPWIGSTTFQEVADSIMLMDDLEYDCEEHGVCSENPPRNAMHKLTPEVPRHTISFLGRVRRKPSPVKIPELDSVDGCACVCKRVVVVFGRESEILGGGME